MPNWKSYESSVRLLAAIVAAHPELKLNYNEIGKLYGGGTKYKAVWDRMTQINAHAKSLKTAFDKGVDPIEVELNEANKPQAQDIAVKFGGDCTKSAVENRFRRIKSDAALINDAGRIGVDPITLDIGGIDGATPMKGGVGRELKQCFGSDATVSALQNRFWGAIKKDVEAIHAARTAGLDCKDAALPSLKGDTSGKNISKYFGTDSTGGGIGFQFRTIKAYAQLARGCADAGGDPQTLKIPSSGKDISKYYPEASAFSLQHRLRSILKDAKAMREAGGPIALHLNDDTTSSAIEHRFRPIKKEAEAMKAAIASSYGEGASGKAVSTYFERMRKDPQWNLANTIEDNANGTGGAGSAKKATPRKTPSKAKKNATMNDDDSGDVSTPTKKKAMNKVASGRVTKPARASAKKVSSYAEADEDNEDDDEAGMIKPEPEGFNDIEYSSSSRTNSQGNGNSNGHKNNYAVTAGSANHSFSTNVNSNEWSNDQEKEERDYFHDADNMSDTEI